MLPFRLAVHYLAQSIIDARRGRPAKEFTRPALHLNPEPGLGFTAPAIYTQMAGVDNPGLGSSTETVVEEILDQLVRPVRPWAVLAIADGEVGAEK